MGLFSKIPSTQTYERKRQLHEIMHARLLDIKRSDNFIRYEELKAYVQSPDFENELNYIRSLSYNTSKERLEERRLKELRSYPEVKKFRKTGIDSESDYVREYIDLEDKVTSPSFLQHKAYLKNKKRHLQSDPYQKYLEYKRLDKSNYIKQYFKVQKKYAGIFAEMDQWEMVFNDVFHEKKLAPHWDTKPYWSAFMRSQNYSHNTEEHYLSDGNNILLTGDVAQIITRHEPATGIAWDDTMGFIPRDFSYTSGMISTAHHFQVGYGRFEAKLCLPNIKNIYHACWLGSDQFTPAISVAQYCNKRLVTGAYQANKTNSFLKKLKLHHDRFYIFQLERNERTITWYINGKKIASCPNTIEEPLYIAFASGVIGQTNDHKLPVAFEIAHVQFQVIKEV